MTFQPVIPLGGVAGWRFLQRTEEAQRQTFADGAQMRREIAYFEANIAEADTASKLVADPILLKIALGAFGMAEEAPKKALIRKVLEEGTESREAIANRFVDPRYRELSAAFGYGDSKGAQVGRETFVADIVARYKVRSFEEAVGAVDNTMRLALNFERAAGAIGGSPSSDGTKWARLLGDVPLRTVIEGALGLPREFSQLDLDRQIDDLQSRFSRVFGADVSALADPELRDRVLRRYFAVEQAKQGPNALTPGASALALLQGGGGLGPLASASLFQSRL